MYLACPWQSLTQFPTPENEGKNESAPPLKKQE